MSVETIGIDHIYAAVREMDRSEEFYDRVRDLANNLATPRLSRNRQNGFPS